MHWPSAYHYAVIVQQERVQQERMQRARAPGRELSVHWVVEWLRTLSKTRARSQSAARGRPVARPRRADRIDLKGGSALPGSGSPT